MKILGTAIRTLLTVFNRFLDIDKKISWNSNLHFLASLARSQNKRNICSSERPLLDINKEICRLLF